MNYLLPKLIEKLWLQCNLFSGSMLRFVIVFPSAVLLFFTACSDSADHILTGQNKSRENLISAAPKALEKIIDAMPEDAILTIPTYDGGNQVVHPDIAFFPKKDFGYQFLMVITPYPYSKDAFENPCLYAGNDGVTFVEPFDDINPLVNAPAYGFNDDPDIYYDSITGELKIYYLETMVPDSQNLICLSSDDSRNWQKNTAIHYDLSNGDDFVLSPAIIRVNDNYRIYYVSKARNRIRYMESRDGINWNKDEWTEVETGLPDTLRPWHLNVFGDNNSYFIIWNGYAGHRENLHIPYKNHIFLAKSKDLETWKFSDVPILKSSQDFHNSRKLYRSHALACGNTLAVWYSFSTTDGRWRLGFKKFALDSLLSGIGL
jgi:hypothetical protein